LYGGNVRLKICAEQNVTLSQNVSIDNFFCRKRFSAIVGHEQDPKLSKFWIKRVPIEENKKAAPI